jgi:hypothetical protein
MVPIVSKVGSHICHGCNVSAQYLLTAFLFKFHSVAVASVNLKLWETVIFIELKLH